MAASPRAAEATLAATAPPAAPAPPQLQRTVWQVGGEPTEVLELASSTGQPLVHLVVIPGNPGAAPFYEPFMHALHRELGGRAAVCCVSNLGMDCMGLTPGGRVFSLEDQIRHKQALLRERFVGRGQPPVVVMGHSIGTYMAIHALHRAETGHSSQSSAEAAALDAVAAREMEHPDAAASSLDGMQRELEAELEAAQQRRHAERQQEQAAAGAGEGDSDRGEADGQPQQQDVQSNVVKVIGLYPFLTVDPECSKQRRLRRITPHHRALAALASGLLGPLPVALRRGLVRALSSGLDPHAVDVAAQVFARGSCVENGFYMGMTEFEALAAPADWWLLQWLGPRFAVFAAPGDVWFKRWKWDLMHREVPGVEAHFVEGQSHAFCVSAKQSEDLAARIRPIVEAALPVQAKL